MPAAAAAARSRSSNELRRVVAASEPELPADVGVRMEAFLATLEGGTDDRPDAQG